MTDRTSMPSRTVLRLAIAVLALLAIAGSMFGSQAIRHVYATGTVAKFVLAPKPIGTTGSTANGARVPVVVTAEDSSNNAVPGATIWLSFQQAVGGGTAFVGSKALRPKAAAFTADSNGQVTITFTTPAAYPNQGVDAIHALNASASASATIKSSDSFCYSPIASMAFVPNPIARKGQLGANSTVPVTLTAFDSHGSRLANTPVYLLFKPTTNGGSATVGATSLSATPQSFMTNSNGQVLITYKTGATPPSTGVDRLRAENESHDACASSGAQYKY